MIIKNYIDSYNSFEIANMVADFDENIVFENIQNGETNMSFNHTDNRCEIEIYYKAILAMDFPNGLKKGKEINLTGKSIFEFDGDKIIRLTDIS